MNTIGERIKWLRKERCRKTQEEVGKYVGVGKATIQKYENAIITNIPSDKIELLAEVLETTPAFIMGWSENPERIPQQIISDSDKLDSEIIRLFLNLSPDGKKKVLDYVHLVQLGEENQVDSSSAQSSSSPTIP